MAVFNKLIRHAKLTKQQNADDPRQLLKEYGTISSESTLAGGTPKSLWRVRKSIVLLMLGTTCLYSAVDANMNIVSSVANEGGLASVALLVYGIVQVVNSIIANAYMPHARSRMALLAAMVALSAYIIANVYISWATYIIAALFQGFGYSLQWIAGNVYNTEIGHYYASLLQENPEPILVRIFGVFNAAVQSGFFFGNVAVYMVLSTNQSEEDFDISNDSSTSCSSCGAAFHEDEAYLIPQLDRPDQNQLFALSAVFATLSFVGCILIALMDDYGSKSIEGSTVDVLQTISGAVKNLFGHMLETRMLLLCPITIFIGMEQAYIMTEFTMAFVGCCLGISNIGLVMICFGAVDVFFCLIQEFAVRVVGRRVVTGIGIIAGLVDLLALILWEPTPDHQEFYYILAALWAILDSILITQVFALYSLIFKDDADAAFSVGILWVSVGFFVPFCYSFPLVQRIKILIMISVLCISAVCSVVLDIKLLTNFQTLT